MFARTENSIAKQALPAVLLLPALTAAARQMSLAVPTTKEGCAAKLSPRIACRKIRP